MLPICWFKSTNRQQTNKNTLLHKIYSTLAPRCSTFSTLTKPILLITRNNRTRLKNREFVLKLLGWLSEQKSHWNPIINFNYADVWHFINTTAFRLTFIWCAVESQKILSTVFQLLQLSFQLPHFWKFNCFFTTA